ncbi:uncharacterized protein V1516DRAFT_669808 [Lipomyces oligophaga]|uniref:uncharacterized protein n=1 Tax=Lipomyces oligophaga TaxID=45792 RepID=UPI0034CE563F
MSLGIAAVRLLAHLFHLAVSTYSAKICIIPVFGSAFVDSYRQLLLTSLFLLFLAYFLNQKRVSKVTAERVHVLTVVYSTVIPVSARYISNAVGLSLGPWYGALAVDLATAYPVVIGTSYQIARIFSVSNREKSVVRLVLIVLASIRLHSIFESRIVSRVLVQFVFPDLYPNAWTALEKISVTNFGSALLIALVSQPRLLALSALLVTLSLFAVPRVVPGGDGVFEGVEKSTVSITGYLSVVRDAKQSLIVLRNDHSLLGGYFYTPPATIKPSLSEQEVDSWVPEPIYSAFVMQEAIRLVIPAPRSQKHNILIVGLGVGTCADAMLRHGLKVDIVELDPMVVQYAVDYFGFQMSQARVTVCDGAYFIHSLAHTFIHRPDETQREDLQKYDYIVHDVFTGGTIAPTMFTAELWQDVQHIMAPDGVLAVNVGGDLSSSLVQALIRTVVQSFKSIGGRCRAFRDSPRQGISSPDFANAVLFCRRQEGGPIRFRPSQKLDYLNSKLRKQALDMEIEIELPVYLDDSQEIVLDSSSQISLDRHISEANVHRFASKSVQAEMEHWSLMNNVLDWNIWVGW